MKSDRKKDWFDDDSFWRDAYPFLFPEERFVHAEEQTEKLTQLVDRTGKDVLDLCCGPGRFAIPLAGRGFHVTGVDRTHYFLNKARARARAAGDVFARYLATAMRRDHPPSRCASAGQGGRALQRDVVQNAGLDLGRAETYASPPAWPSLYENPIVSAPVGFPRRGHGIF